MRYYGEGYASIFDLERTIAPAANFLTDARVWDHLRVDLSGSPAEPVDKDDIDMLRDAAEAELDGFDGLLGRAVITQTWAMKLRCFPQYLDRIHKDRRIVLPCPPLQSVTSITYVDPDGVSQTLDSGDYTVLTAGNERGAVIPAWGKTWPSTRDVPQAVTVTFVAGYGDDAADVPGDIINAGLLRIRAEYDQLAGKDREAVEARMMALLGKHRVAF